jgi:hypothetical protein
VQPLVLEVVESVDKPCVDGAGLARETEADEDRSPHEGPYSPSVLGRSDVKQRCDQECPDAEQVRRLAPDGVRDHAGRHLEEYLSGTERGVDEHDLEDVEARVQQEERVHAPDERGSECEQPT